MDASDSSSVPEGRFDRCALSHTGRASASSDRSEAHETPLSGQLEPTLGLGGREQPGRSSERGLVEPFEERGDD